MQFRSSPERYGVVAIALHWIVVVLVLLAWILGTIGDELPRGALSSASQFVHISAGVAIFALLVIRLGWRLFDPPPQPEKTLFGRWGDYASTSVHWLLYALLGAIIVAGIVAQFADGDPLPLFGLFDITSPWAKNHRFAEAAEEVHEFLANALMVVVGIHAAAALVHHWLLKDRTLSRILPGGARLI